MQRVRRRGALLSNNQSFILLLDLIRQLLTLALVYLHSHVNHFRAIILFKLKLFSWQWHQL